MLMDCWWSTIALDLKVVSVELAGFGRALPTFNLGFYEDYQHQSPSQGPEAQQCADRKDQYTWKSFFLSFFFFALDPIVMLVLPLCSAS